MNQFVVARAELVESIKTYDEPRGTISVGSISLSRRDENKFLYIIKIANSNGCSVTIDGYRRTLFRAYYTGISVEGETWAVIDYVERLYFFIGGKFEDFN